MRKWKFENQGPEGVDKALERLEGILPHIKPECRERTITATRGIWERRAIRRYLPEWDKEKEMYVPKPVPLQLLYFIIDCARTAPSPDNVQPERYIILDPNLPTPRSVNYRGRRVSMEDINKTPEEIIETIGKMSVGHACKVFGENITKDMYTRKMLYMLELKDPGHHVPTKDIIEELNGWLDEPDYAIPKKLADATKEEKLEWKKAKLNIVKVSTAAVQNGRIFQYLRGKTAILAVDTQLDKGAEREVKDAKLLPIRDQRFDEFIKYYQNTRKNPKPKIKLEDLVEDKYKDRHLEISFGCPAEILVFYDYWLQGVEPVSKAGSNGPLLHSAERKACFCAGIGSFIVQYMMQEMGLASNITALAADSEKHISRTAEKIGLGKIIAEDGDIMEENGELFINPFRQGENKWREMAVVSIGHPLRRRPLGPRRLPVEEIAYVNRWGHPLKKKYD